MLTKEQWKRRIEEWRISGKTQLDFCREQGLNKSTFYYWKKRLDGGSPSSPRKTRLNLVPVEVRGQAKDRADRPTAARIVLGNGLAVEWPVSADTRELVNLIATLRRL